MKARAIATAAVLAVLLAPGWASAAEGIAGKLAIAAQVGTQTELDGNLLASGESTLVDRPASFHSVSYRDVFGPEARIQGFIGYGVSEKVELVLRGGYYKSEAVGVEAGTLTGGTLAGVTLAGAKIYAYFTDYEEWNLELAARYYIAHRSRLKSWIAAVAGVRATNNLYVSYSIPDAGIAVLNVPFNTDTTVPVFGADIGVSFDLTDNLLVGLDSGVRWQAASGDAKPLPSLSAIGASEGRWTAPVMLSLGLRF